MRDSHYEDSRASLNLESVGSILAHNCVHLRFSRRGLRGAKRRTIGEEISFRR
jgi:hypothetical protein